METVRIDKWLWAARFYKTRSLAVKAVSGGHVAVNGQRIKPAKMIQQGDLLDIRQGTNAYAVRVLEVSDRRGPAVVARTLYAETEESVLKREQARVERAAMQPAGMRPEQRPDKHQRRKIRKFLQKD